MGWMDGLDGWKFGKMSSGNIELGGFRRDRSRMCVCVYVSFCVRVRMCVCVDSCACFEHQQTQPTSSIVSYVRFGIFQCLELQHAAEFQASPVVVTLICVQRSRVSYIYSR